MEVSIWEVRDYIYIEISIVFFFLIQNIHLIPYKYLFNLKRKVKNKTHVKTSICNAYIVKEISIFILYYFESHLKIRINHIPRYDDGRKASSRENLA
jgi:hypothetical protein